MLATKTKQIIQEIRDYISQNGGYYPAWYVGITCDINSRLFGDHGVRRNGDQWIYSTAPTSSDARDIEKYFIDLGADGGSGGGDDTSKIVYAYKKNSHTTP